MNTATFGKCLRDKRIEKQISLRGFAGKLGISPVYMCNIEKDRVPAPKDHILTEISRLLILNDEEEKLFYDLAAKSKTSPTVSKDLPDYIMEKDIVRAALRTAKDVDATDEEWQEFIDKLEKRRKAIEEDDI